MFFFQLLLLALASERVTSHSAVIAITVGVSDGALLYVCVCVCVGFFFGCCCAIPSAIVLTGRLADTPSHSVLLSFIISLFLNERVTH